VNNCVGVNNRKDFVLFLFYATLSQACAMGLIVARIVDWVKNAGGKNVPAPVMWHVVLAALDLVFLLPVTLAVGGLLWYQISCIVENLTTIDEYVMERQQRAAHKLRKPYRWAYDLGCWRNWCAFFGSSVPMWFVPGSVRWDGIRFEKRKE
jgi:hypothetical protein